MHALGMIVLILAGLFLVYGYTRFSIEAPRLALGLNTAHCPHCQALDTLDTEDTLSVYRAALAPNEDNLVCSACHKTCTYSDIFPSQEPEPENPVPLPPAA